MFCASILQMVLTNDQFNDFIEDQLRSSLDNSKVGKKFYFFTS